MNSEWKEMTWEDVIELKYGKSLKGYKENTEGYRVFGSNGPIGFSPEKLGKGPAVILGRKGAYRGVEYSKGDFWVIDTAYFMQPKIDLDVKWLYYASVGYKLGEINDGSPIPSTPRNFVYKERLNLPPLQEQKRIAHILGTLDDKIELNRKMNETLEAMAQALFKSWFVDFDPVIDNALAAGNPIPEPLQKKAEARRALKNSPPSKGGVPEGGGGKKLPKETQSLFPSSFTFKETLNKWIPEGWEVDKFNSIVEVKYGKDHKKLAEGQFPCYGSGGIMRYVESTLCETESVLIPRKGTLNNLMYVRNPFWSVDTMFFTLFKEENYAKYIFYFLQKFNFSEMNVGSAVPSMTTAVLNNIDLLTPTKELLVIFNQKIELLFKKKEASEKQIDALTKTRDTLLPKLISGKIKV